MFPSLGVFLFYCCVKAPGPQGFTEEMAYLELTVHRMSSWASWWEAWQLEGRHGSGAVAGSYIFRYSTRQKEVSMTVMGFWNLKACPQWNICSKKATPPNASQPAIPTGEQAFKYMNLWGSFQLNLPLLIIKQFSLITNVYKHYSSPFPAYK